MQFGAFFTLLLASVAVAAPTPQRSGSRVKPGTPVNDPTLPLKPGEFCSTTSQEGVLGCDTGTGNTFRIVNGQRRES